MSEAKDLLSERTTDPSVATLPQDDSARRQTLEQHPVHQRKIPSRIEADRDVCPRTAGDAGRSGSGVTLRLELTHGSRVIRVQHVYRPLGAKSAEQNDPVPSLPRLPRMHDLGAAGAESREGDDVVGERHVG